MLRLALNRCLSQHWPATWLVSSSSYLVQQQQYSSPSNDRNAAAEPSKSGSATNTTARPNISSGSGSSSPLVGKEVETPMLHAIRNRIMVRGGPLSVSEFMQEVLTNPISGYYMKRDVFGKRGDFVTSPEVSQVFGELVGIWCVLVWQSLGNPSRFNLVELGPGRGTLMADLLRGTAAFKQFSEAMTVHLVEVSPHMRSQQWNKLRCSSSSDQQANSHTEAPKQQQHQQQQLELQQQEVVTGVSSINGAQVTWHGSLDAVPNSGPSLYIAHEFLDALPVHQFIKDPRRGWLEVMIDTADDVQDTTTGSGSMEPTTLLQQQLQSSRGIQAPQQQQQQQQDSSLHLRYVLSPSPTPASQLLVPRRLAAMQQQQQGQQQWVEPAALEIGAHAMAVCETLSRRIAAAGGAALLIDYGQDGPYENSLTAIKDHKGVHPLSQPGLADLSAWVDFSAMRLAAQQAQELELESTSPAVAAAAAAAGASRIGTAATSRLPAAAGAAAAAAGRAVDIYGPIDQAGFLHGLGIQARFQALAEAANPEQVGELTSAYQRLTDTGPGGMGGTYLAMAITQQGLEVPVPFAEQQQQQQQQQQHVIDSCIQDGSFNMMIDDCTTAGGSTHRRTDYGSTTSDGGSTLMVIGSFDGGGFDGGVCDGGGD